MNQFTSSVPIYDFAILGAGVAGLSAARILSPSLKEWLSIRKSKQVGWLGNWDVKPPIGACIVVYVMEYNYDEIWEISRRTLLILFLANNYLRCLKKMVTIIFSSKADDR